MNAASVLARLAVLLLAALAWGCTSMVGLGYRHADTVAAWKADQYFDLDADQEREFRARFARLHEWHRYEALPEYVEFLTAARDRLKRGIAAADVAWFTDGLKTRYRRVVARAAPDAADLLATLSDEQIEHLKRRWAEDNGKFADDHRLGEPLEARQKARAKRLAKQVRDWAGSLSEAQEKQISELAAALPDTERLRHQDRLRRQREFVRLLEQRGGDRKAFADALARWLSDWESGRVPAYARIADEAWRQRMEFYVAVSRMLTREQQGNLLQRLQGHIVEFERLAQRG